MRRPVPQKRDRSLGQRAVVRGGGILILKGNQRGGGQQLAAHLMNSFDNERVEIADMRGAIADDLSGAFAEWAAQASATKIQKKYFYSLSANPDQAQGHLTREQYFDLIERTERSLKLVGQPRAVVFHEKRDKDGMLREHCHVVWSRVDTSREKVKAVQIEHDRLKLRTVAREFARDHGLELPDGMKKDGKRDRFDDRAKQENLAERQQKERTGISKAERMADIATCWKETSNGAAFVNALEAKGYYLASGGSRRAYVVVDLNGEVHSLSRQLVGVANSKALQGRLAGHPPGKLPDVEAARAWAKKEREQRQKDQVRQPSEAETRHAALKLHQQQRREDLDYLRINLIGRHMTEREGLKAAHEAQNAGIATARLQKQPKGIMAFLARVTGIKLIVEARQKQHDKARAAEHKQQTESLQRTHDRELHEMDRRYRALAGLEARENTSAETALKREEFQLLLKKQPARVLKPEFDRAVQPGRGRTGTEDGKPLKETFDKALKAAKPPIDLTEAFNREVENRISREERDRDRDGPDRTLDPKDRNR
jgi:hypothetical protein